MKPDLYTKVILTVIAACLVWICIKDVTFNNRVNAQTTQRVILAGIDGYPQEGFPVQIKSIKRGKYSNSNFYDWDSLSVLSSSPTPIPSLTPR